MTDPFDDIQDIWKQQAGSKTQPLQPDELIRVAKINTKEIRTRHIWTIAVLICSILILAGYLAAYGGSGFSQFQAGLALMIFSLLLRLIIEQISLIHFRKIDISADLNSYTKRIMAFYGRRKKIHYGFTPVIIAAYIAGFVLLLPFFKRAFSTGFFLYIIISGAVFFIIFTWLLVRQIKKEMQLLHFLKGVHP